MVDRNDARGCKPLVYERISQKVFKSMVAQTNNDERKLLLTYH